MEASEESAMFKWVGFALLGSVTVLSIGIYPNIDWSMLHDIFRPKVITTWVGDCLLAIDRDSGRTLNRECAKSDSNPGPRNPAPEVGSKLPRDMIPGEWYATGNSKTVESGTYFDTSSRDCVRDGVKGKCAFKKRGS